jgi:hypothetical protein
LCPRGNAGIRIKRPPGCDGAIKGPAAAKGTAMTNVLITIDTEYSAGGYFEHPETENPVTDQVVFCRIGDRSHGLGFLLETFAEFGVKATFFIEGAHTLMLGPEPMRAAVAAILDAGHDAQLHIHPMWLAGENGRIPTRPVNDSIHAMDEESCRRAIEAGQAAFSAWGAPPPSSFRAGNFAMGRAAYRTLSSCGIPISSSIGVGISRPDETELWIEGGRRIIDGVVEVPVLAYADAHFGARRHLRNLSITGSGTSETAAVLLNARAQGVEDVVLLTHPFEFIKKYDFRYRDLEPNRVNQRRLRKLCAWLSASEGAFKTVTFTERAGAWLERGEAQSAPVLAPLSTSLMRMVENKLNDSIRWY